MQNLLQQLSLIGIVPVIKIDDAKDAAPLAGALVEGGLPCAEVTFRTAAAPDAIRAMRDAYPDILLGAGTVLTPAQVDQAVEAGASFIVSPGLNPAVVEHCLEKGIPVLPGINNPTGIEQALALGLKTVKFFPAEPSGGLTMLKAMAAPYGGVKFMPTGGINPSNVGSYLAWNKIVACGGSWMVPSDRLAAGDFDGIKALVRGAVDTMLDLRFAHIGINCTDNDLCESSAATASALFGMEQKKGEKSIFVGKPFEFMRYIGVGSVGHIGMATPNVDRAMFHLARRGARFDESTIQKDADGSTKFVYIKDEIAGFAYHLVKG
ncbi:MAG: bifunctional 4-hydroxy-2-oxoglutarate aldolase/2-dehydro-3-deoxy-phosphogluconate aldolase [Clostridia bacterium]|nr:bifunctional 4-hydroxy-2-oxoglutarate aldolase/2-dehydro-3-deoxy-phosphogluconate aldolase [Clostridia bacterium]